MPSSTPTSESLYADDTTSSRSYCPARRRADRCTWREGAPLAVLPAANRCARTPGASDSFLSKFEFSHIMLEFLLLVVILPDENFCSSQVDREASSTALVSSSFLSPREPINSRGLRKAVFSRRLAGRGTCHSQPRGCFLCPTSRACERMHRSFAKKNDVSRLSLAPPCAPDGDAPLDYRVRCAAEHYPVWRRFVTNQRDVRCGRIPTLAARKSSFGRLPQTANAETPRRLNALCPACRRPVSIPSASRRRCRMTPISAATSRRRLVRLCFVSERHGSRSSLHVHLRRGASVRSRWPVSSASGTPPCTIFVSARLSWT